MLIYFHFYKNTYNTFVTKCTKEYFKEVGRSKVSYEINL